MSKATEVLTSGVGDDGQVTNEALQRMASLPGDWRLSAMARELLSLRSRPSMSGPDDTVALSVLANDPNAVHINLLRGSLARPSLSQIIHIYGADALRSALVTPSPTASAQPKGEAVAWQWRQARGHVWRSPGYGGPQDVDWYLARPNDYVVRYLYAHPAPAEVDKLRELREIVASLPVTDIELLRIRNKGEADADIDTTIWGKSLCIIVDNLRAIRNALKGGAA